MRDATADQLVRIEAKLDYVIALLTDEGAEDEEAEEMVEIVTMDGQRHQVAPKPGLSLSRERET